MKKLRIFWCHHKKEIVLGAVIVMVASLSFGFGYLAGRGFNHAPILIEECGDTPH